MALPQLIQPQMKKITECLVGPTVEAVPGDRETQKDPETNDRGTEDPTSGPRDLPTRTHVISTFPSAIPRCHPRDDLAPKKSTNEE